MPHAWSQSVTLVYKQKGKSSSSVNISNSSAEGKAQVSLSEFQNSDKVYFVIKPEEGSDRMNFKEGELKNELSAIQLFQAEKLILRTEPFLPIVSEGKIQMIVLTYFKKDFAIYKPLVFKSPVADSKPYTLPEIFFPGFQKFNSFYNETKKQLSANEPEAAFNLILKAIDEGKNEEPFKYFSFYNELTGKLMADAISSRIHQQKTSFDGFLIKMNESLQKRFLTSADSLVEVMRTFAQKATPYTTANFERSHEMKGFIQTELEKVGAEQKQSYTVFSNIKLTYLEQNKYSNYQFRLLIDLISKSLLYANNIGQSNQKMVLQPAYSRKTQDELKKADWLNDYDDLLFALNHKIANETGAPLFNAKIIDNLLQQQTKQPKPYYELFSAVNAFFTKSTNYTTLLQEAIRFSTDDQDVGQMELMMMVNSGDSRTLSNTAATNMNQGLKNLKDQKWKEADYYFELAIRQSSDFAPAWYFLGVAEYYMDEGFSANARFDQALQLNPDYISPKLFQFKILLDNADYETLFIKTSEAGESAHMYLLYYWKAIALFKLGKFEDAIKEIKTKCISMTTQHTGAYFLLGDIYKELKQYNLARENYQITQSINPFESGVFSTKMKELTSAN